METSWNLHIAMICYHWPSPWRPSASVHHWLHLSGICGPSSGCPGCAGLNPASWLNFNKWFGFVIFVYRDVCWHKLSLRPTWEKIGQGPGRLIFAQQSIKIVWICNLCPDPTSTSWSFSTLGLQSISTCSLLEKMWHSRRSPKYGSWSCHCKWAILCTNHQKLCKKWLNVAL